MYLGMQEDEHRAISEPQRAFVRLQAAPFAFLEWRAALTTPYGD